jgi:hypothetical protein
MMNETLCGVRIVSGKKPHSSSCFRWTYRALNTGQRSLILTGPASLTRALLLRLLCFASGSPGA